MNHTQLNSACNEASPCALHRVARNSGETKLLIIIAISLVTMVGEIIGGSLFGSMALLADGWHMGTHVLALGIAFAACVLAKKIATDRRFGFGPAKVSALGGFAGAILLGAVAFEMVAEGIQRLLSPEKIQFTEAMIVAVIGLIVNAVGAALLHEGAHSHSHDHHNSHSHPLEHPNDHHVQSHAHSHPSGGHGHDANMKSAYLHVITDALTSVLAIAALFLGSQFGWVWADAAVAMLGGVIILKWAFSLLKDSGATLLDFVPVSTVHHEIETTIRGAAENRITDLHVWPQGAAYGVLATVTCHHDADSATTIHQRLKQLGYLEHITVEVHRCACH
ncbi:MAG: CDF family Co(II)/Ni(II) efflux transporter DmeF [Deltaproteobacteria bacterium]|nr:CDF family Co(II)/Ni(II) efflux transporter DmeF [Deltaproteobacteria bacterium]